MENKIKKIREKKRLTQEELAKIAGVSRNTISSLESRTANNITLNIMKKIAKALETKVEIIFFL